MQINYFHNSQNPSQKALFSSKSLPQTKTVKTGLKTWEEAEKFCKDKSYQIHGVTGNLMVVKYFSNAPQNFS